MLAFAPMNEPGQSNIINLHAARGVGDRIKFVRNREKLNQEKFGKRIGVSRGAVGNWELGKGITPENIRKICDEFSVSAEWLLNNRGMPHSVAAKNNVIANDISNTAQSDVSFSRGGYDHMMPIYASAEAGPGEMIVTSDPVDYVPRPSIVEHVESSFGFEIRGDSMFPAYKPGERAFVNPLLTPIAGDDCIVYANNHRLGEERVMIKEFVRATPDEWVLRQYNPAGEIRLARGEWQRIFKVVGKFNR